MSLTTDTTNPTSPTQLSQRQTPWSGSWGNQGGEPQFQSPNDDPTGTTPTPNLRPPAAVTGTSGQNWHQRWTQNVNRTRQALNPQSPVSADGSIPPPTSSGPALSPGQLDRTNPPAKQADPYAGKVWSGGDWGRWVDPASQTGGPYGNGVQIPSQGAAPGSADNPIDYRTLQGLQTPWRSSTPGASPLPGSSPGLWYNGTPAVSGGASQGEAQQNQSAPGPSTLDAMMARLPPVPGAYVPGQLPQTALPDQGAVNAQYNQNLLQMLQHPTSMTDEGTAQLKEQQKEQALAQQQQILASMGQGFASRGTLGGGTQAATELNAREATGQQILGANRSIDLQRMQQDQADRQATLTSGMQGLQGQQGLGMSAGNYALNQALQQENLNQAGQQSQYQNWQAQLQGLLGMGGLAQGQDQLDQQSQMALLQAYGLLP